MLKGGTSTNGHFAAVIVLVRPFGVWNGWWVWFEVETRYWVVRLHAAPALCGVCGWSSLLPVAGIGSGGGVGLFLENCIVDASIL